MEIKFKCNPLKSIHATSPFGMRIHPITKDSKFHNGVDLRAKSGTPLYAVDDGVVIVSKANANNPKTGVGWYVVVQHVGYYVIYAHMLKQGLAVGTKVKSGQVIGLSGNSGASQAPHLHFELRNGKYYSGTWSEKKSDGRHADALNPEQGFIK